ncbi:MAG TPA: hypothetical protein VFA34_15850 [Actinomycetota bacterium]|nr:hypothetical protein [Actinomycetota bacterium]
MTDDLVEVRAQILGKFRTSMLELGQRRLECCNRVAHRVGV